MATLVHEWAEEREMSCSTAFSQQQGAQHPRQPGSVPWLYPRISCLGTPQVTTEDFVTLVGHPN